MKLIGLQSGAELEPLQVKLDEAARLLSISRRQVDREIAEGRLAAIGHGQLRRIALADLRRWQDAHRTGGSEAA